MRTSKRQGIPPRLEEVRRRFERWRRKRRIGSRIPERLWAAAVTLAEEYGTSPTARALGLDYYSLKNRLEEAADARPTPQPGAQGAFVELVAAAQMGGPECLLELEHVDGTKMRIHFKGVEAPDLVALSRSLWGVE